MNRNRCSRRDFLRVSTAAVAGTVLAACAAPTVSTTPASPQATTAPTTGPAAEQTLRLRVPNPFTNILPHRAGGEDRIPGYYAFVPPYWATPTGGAEPGFALSHDVSDDALTWTLHLDPQAIFSNGKPITAAAVKKCWEWGMWPANQVAFGGSYLLLRPVVGAPSVWDGSATEAEGLEALDDQTLQITFSTTPYGWEGALTQSYLGVYDVEAAEEDPEGFLTKPVTSGLYLSELDSSTGVCTLTRNPNWWREPATIERFETVVISDDQAAVIAFDNGEFDILRAWFQLVPIAQERYQPEQLHSATQGPGMWYLDINCALAPTDDVWVRRALLHSIDRHAANEALSGGSIKILDSIMNPVFPCFNPEQTIPYDPELARQELAQSSYGSAASVPPIKAYYPAGRALWGDFLTYFQDQWQRELGLQVDVTEVTGPRQEDWNLHRTSFGPPIADEAYYLSPMFGTAGAQAGVNGCFDPDIDVLLNEADTLPPSEQERRCELYRQAEAKLLEDAKMVPLGETVAYYVTQPWVKFDQAVFPWPLLVNFSQWRMERA